MMKKHSRKKTAHPAVDIERLTGILGHLPDAPTSPRRTDTQRHLIEQLREPLLQAVTQQGYSLQKLADLLREEGVTIHPSTLRRYLGPMGVSPAKRRQPPSPGDPPGTQVFSSGVAAPENSIPDPFQRPSVAPEVPPAPPASPVLNLSSRFIPKPEVPYDELIRQGQARQKLRGEPATESALQPPDEAADPEPARTITGTIHPSEVRMNSQSPNSPAMFAVGGCKGGVGKSMVALALVDDLLQRGERVLLIETDTANPDVWRMYAREPGVVAETLDLDQAEGWIDLINLCDSHPERVVVINTAARNHQGVAAHGATLNRALPELRRRLVTLWVINTQRDSLELLEDYLRSLPGTVTHVVRNTFFGSPDTFGLYPTLAVSEDIARRGGQVLTLDRLADRVSGDLYSRRLSIARAVQRGGPDALPLGNRAELERWRETVARMLAAIVPAELPPPAPPPSTRAPAATAETPAV